MGTRQRRADGATRDPDARRRKRARRDDVSRRRSCRAGRRWSDHERATAKRFPQRNTFSRAVRGCRNCFRRCSASAFFRRVRKSFSSRRQPATRRAARRRCRRGFIIPISFTDCPIWKTAASRSASTNTVRRSIPIADHACRARKDWRPRAIISRSVSRNCATRRSRKAASANTRTRRTGISSSTVIRSATIS